MKIPVDFAGPGSAIPPGWLDAVAAGAGAGWLLSGGFGAFGSEIVEDIAAAEENLRPP